MDEQRIFSASKYLPCTDLWVIATYYNPARYLRKRQNYDRFAAPIRDAGIPLLTVECAIGDEDFELPSSDQVLQVRSRDGMWLKERLINLAISRLPPQARKLAWLDTDFLFLNPAWAQEASALLEEYPLIQLYASLSRLSRDESRFEPKEQRSFASTVRQKPESALSYSHGPPGLAWAARRSLIEGHGLYDASIIGGGDELFAHAAGGGLNSRCVRRITGTRVRRLSRIEMGMHTLLHHIHWPRSLAKWRLARSRTIAKARPEERFFAHYLSWARCFSDDVQRRIGCVPGTAVHLWHGDGPNRHYITRYEILSRHGYDPSSDLRRNPEGVWEWASDKPGLHQDIADYFIARKEDG